ncbi:MAG: hypothetical protein KGH55_03645 [Nanoarchaeota archaeon]|nr:hypothetical protein [Nanoarchaeota archaeon]
MKIPKEIILIGLFIIFAGVALLVYSRIAASPAFSITKDSQPVNSFQLCRYGTLPVDCSSFSPSPESGKYNVTIKGFSGFNKTDSIKMLDLYCKEINSTYWNCSDYIVGEK